MLLLLRRALLIAFIAISFIKQFPLKKKQQKSQKPRYQYGTGVHFGVGNRVKAGQATADTIIFSYIHKKALELLLLQGFMFWCGKRDLNPHGCCH
jgi:hypothetical protein